jgi:hypothetical protein
MKRKIVLFYGYQRFKYVRKGEYVTKDKRIIPMLVMQSYCPDCGKKYEVMIPKSALASGVSLNRRCKKCKNPRVCIPATRLKIFGIL